MSDLISYGFPTPPAVLILLSLAGALLALRWRGFGGALDLRESILHRAARQPRAHRDGRRRDACLAPAARALGVRARRSARLAVARAARFWPATTDRGCAAEHHGIARQRLCAARDDRS